MPKRNQPPADSEFWQERFDAQQEARTDDASYRDREIQNYPAGWDKFDEH